MPFKVVSGGQTGVDRAALDAAIHVGREHGGWCPRGRKAEDGAIDGRYQLKETATDAYEQSTIENIADSDATLIVIPEETELKSISDGTKLTVQQLKAVSKPFFIVRISSDGDLDRQSLVGCRQWLSKIVPKVLNIAGPRESTAPGIYAKSFDFFVELLTDK